MMVGLAPVRGDPIAKTVLHNHAAMSTPESEARGERRQKNVRIDAIFRLEGVCLQIPIDVFYLLAYNRPWFRLRHIAYWSGRKLG